MARTVSHVLPRRAVVSQRRVRGQRHHELSLSRVKRPLQHRLVATNRVHHHKTVCNSLFIVYLKAMFLHCSANVDCTVRRVEFEYEYGDR
jgi:hypothetical protein